MVRSSLFVLLLLAGLISGCQASSIDSEEAPESTLPAETVTVVAPVEPLISAQAVDLLIYFEVSGEAVYRAKYQRPICPLCDSTQSGPTIGIGYDLGQKPASAIRADWIEHPQMEHLLRASGVKGKAAIPVTNTLSFVVTPYPLAYQVFEDTSIVEYYRVARRAFGPEFVNLHPNAKGALVSVVYNRGGSTSCTLASRAEMCKLANECVPSHNYECIADQIRSMKRLWTNKGLRDRRDMEADLVLRR